LRLELLCIPDAKRDHIVFYGDLTDDVSNTDSIIIYTLYTDRNDRRLTIPITEDPVKSIENIA
jgi:hypothetical protein